MAEDKELEAQSLTGDSANKTPSFVKVPTFVPTEQ